jgi:hypothetical protein
MGGFQHHHFHYSYLYSIPKLVLELAHSPCLGVSTNAMSPGHAGRNKAPVPSTNTFPLLPLPNFSPPSQQSHTLSFNSDFNDPLPQLLENSLVPKNQIKLPRYGPTRLLLRRHACPTRLLLHCPEGPARIFLHRHEECVSLRPPFTKEVTC